VDNRRRTVALVVLCLCAFTTAVDVTITNVALPFVSADLKASTGDLQWVIDSYNIMLAGLLVLGGGLADRIGRKTVFLGGYALFGIACLLAASSSSADQLIAARALMGVGAAGVVAPALAIIATLYEPDERARTIATWAVFGAAGLAVGPVSRRDPAEPLLVGLGLLGQRARRRHRSGAGRPFHSAVATVSGPAR